MITISVAELEERERKLEAEIQEKQDILEAIRKTRVYIQTGGVNGSDNGALAKTTKVLKSSAPRYGENTRLVRTAIKQMSRNYTIRDIRRVLTHSGTPLSDNALTTVMNRLKTNGEIKEIRKGRGRKPALFRL